MALNLVSCDSDIDPVYVLPTDTISLGGASGDIVLTPDNPQALAMTIYWSGDGRIALSDTLLQKLHKYFRWKQSSFPAMSNFLMS